jgi:hypothetical protein
VAGDLDVAPVFASSGQVVAGGAFELQFSGLNGSGYTVRASTNLTSWTTIATGTFDGNPVTFTDTNAVSHPDQFYRVSVP